MMQQMAPPLNSGRGKENFVQWKEPGQLQGRDVHTNGETSTLRESGRTATEAQNRKVRTTT